MTRPSPTSAQSTLKLRAGGCADKHKHTLIQGVLLSLAPDWVLVCDSPLTPMVATCTVSGHRSKHTQSGAISGAVTKILLVRQEHATQAIKAMWMRKGQAMNPEVHTYNRYSCVTQTKVDYFLRATWPNLLQGSGFLIGWAMFPFSCNSFFICVVRVWGAVGSESSFMGWFQCPWRICSETLDSEIKDGQRAMGWSYSCAQEGCLPSKQLSQP